MAWCQRRPGVVMRANTCASELRTISPDEASSFRCNAVVVGNSVILNAGVPKLAADLASIGFRTIPLSFTEFIKSGGSAKCLTLRVDGEEAAAWKTDFAEQRI